ncbi:hypothetical protein KPATCC21470_8640 [Kitasatospora purpeofusca]
MRQPQHIQLRLRTVREFRWAKGGQGFAGSYFSATIGDHVGYES